MSNTDRDDWLQVLDAFYRDRIFHELVAEAKANSKQYLQGHEIEGVTLGFFSGILAMVLSEYVSNHVMELG